MPSLECGEIDNEHENENDEEKIGSDRREFRFYQPTEKQTRTKDDDEKGFRNDAKQVRPGGTVEVKSVPVIFVVETGHD